MLVCPGLASGASASSALEEVDSPCLTPQEQQVPADLQARGDRAAVLIRRAFESPEASPDRTCLLRHALSLLEANLDQAPPDSAHHLRARFDRVLALRAAGRYAEAGEAFDSVLDGGLEPPPYVVNAAADSYLAQRMPERAGDLYRRSLAADAGQFDTRIGLFFAQVESEQLEEALALVDELAAGESGHLAVEARVMAAMGRAYAGRLAEAEAMLEQLKAEEPDSPRVAQAMADVQRWRGRPERSLANYERALAGSPGDTGIRTGMVEAWLDLGRHRAAGRELETLALERPDHPAVARVERARELEASPRLELRTEAGDSDGENFGTRDSLARVRLWGPRVNDHWRPFAVGYTASADFPEGDERYRRLGAGVAWDANRVQVQGQVHRAAGFDTGGAMDASWWLNDQWRLGASLDTDSLQVPLRARRRDIGGDMNAASIRYRHSESREASLGFTGLDMDDGNDRRSLSASVSQRLVTRDYYRLAGGLGGYASRNSLENRPYFNPERDASMQASLDQTWIAWRRYESRLSHQLTAHGGLYRQEGFSTEPTGGLRYALEWRWRDSLTLELGAGVRSNVYDGDRERRDYLFFNLTQVY
jgi:biofilm PGA synthesis protein PgaA